MPRGDGTGPAGYGGMTGRGMGYCAGFPMPGFMNPGYGRGPGRGFGRGMGWRRGWNMPFGRAYAPAGPIGPVNAGAEADVLRNQARWLEEELGAVRGRLEELEKGKEKE